MSAPPQDRDSDQDCWVREDEVPDWALVEASMFIRGTYSASIDAWWKHVDACRTCTVGSATAPPPRKRFCVVSAGIAALVSTRFNSTSWHNRENVDWSTAGEG